MSDPQYKRILLKLTGESLKGDSESGYGSEAILNIAGQLAELANMGVQVGVVIGAGNIFRGLSGLEQGIKRVSGDYMGMLATVMNSIALRDAVESFGVKSAAMSAIMIDKAVETYSHRKAISYLEEGRVLIFGGGTGNPYFTTDTAAVLRAQEIEAEAVFKGTKVDGVYSEDPVKNPDAERYTELSFLDVLNKGLRVMDWTAISFCSDNKLPIVVFDITKKGNLKRVICGENIGTIVRG